MLGNSNGRFAAIDFARTARHVRSQPPKSGLASDVTVECNQSLHPESFVYSFGVSDLMFSAKAGGNHFQNEHHRPHRRRSRSPEFCSSWKPIQFPNASDVCSCLSLTGELTGRRPKA